MATNAAMVPGSDMASAAPKLDRKSSDGFILVAVLWILGGLAVLAAIYTLYVVNAASSLAVSNDRIQADASVSAALELTAYYLGAVKPEERPTSGTFNFRAGNSNVAVDFVSEAARIDLNSAPQPLLAGLFRVLGASSDAADYDAERVIGWRSPAASQNVDLDPGKETTAYRNAGRNYDPRLAPFANVQELWLLLGLQPALVERAMHFVTVYSGMPGVNILDAAPEVVAALPGMTPELLDARSQPARRAAARSQARLANARSGTVQCDGERQQCDQGQGPRILGRRPPHQRRGGHFAAGRRARPVSRIILERRLRRLNGVSRVQREIAMNFLRQIADGFSRWMDCVASTVVNDLWPAGGVPRGSARRTGEWNLQHRGAGGQIIPSLMQVQISNGVAGCSGETAAALKGSQVELAMRPERFFFRALELPRRASEFLDGIVREQIDRITPWTASEAVVGWSRPTDVAGDKISVTIAAAPRAQIIPLTQAIGKLGVNSIVVSTTRPDADEDAIRVFEQSAAGALEVRQVRRRLVAGLAIAAILAVLAVASDVVIGGDLQNRQIDASRRIAERRGIIRAGNDAAANSALARLARRKNQTPANVIVLEALSNVLPDNTYVTELRIEGDKVQVVGITNDAPSLIRLIEQSPHFSRATFFAPTTRAPSDPGDRYHIEARIKPVFSPPS